MGAKIHPKEVFSRGARFFETVGNTKKYFDGNEKN